MTCTPAEQNHLHEDDVAPTQCLPDFPFSLRYGFFCTCLPLEEALTTVPPKPPSPQPWYARTLFGKRKTDADATRSVETNGNSSSVVHGNIKGGHEHLEDPCNLPFDDCLIVFVLGGPGSGKGTQCERISKEFGLVHIPTGDLLREEVGKGTELGQEIKNAMEEGKMVSHDVTMKLLLQAMKVAGKNVPGFLIDGFPRIMDQAIEFENTIGRCDFVLYYDCPDDVLVQRLLKRGETSGRPDDNSQSIEKRIQVFEKTSMPVIEYYEYEKRVQRINGNQNIEQVTADTFELFDAVFGTYDDDNTHSKEPSSGVGSTQHDGIKAAVGRSVHMQGVR